MSRCCNCGKEVYKDDVLCENCRGKLNSVYNGNTGGQSSFETSTTTVVNYAPWETPKNGLKNAVLSFVFGLLSLILFLSVSAIEFVAPEVSLCLIYISFPLAIVSLVVGFKSKNNYNKYIGLGVNKDKRIRRFSNLGIAFAIISLVFIVLFIFFGFIAFCYMVLLVLFGYASPGGI